MNSLDVIKNEIKNLYQNNPHIHVNVSMTHPKICLKNEPVTIQGVYAHIFRIEENSGALPKYHSLQYSEVLTGHIEILELQK